MPTAIDQATLITPISEAEDSVNCDSFAEGDVKVDAAITRLNQIVPQLGADPAGASASVAARLSSLDSTVAAKETPAGAQAKVDTHAADTSTHGVADMTALITSDGAQAQVNYHAGLTNVHGVAQVAGIADITKTQVGLPDVTNDAQIAKSLVTTKGDLIATTAASTPARLAVGTDGQVLTADAASAAGVKWAAGGGGGSITVQDIDGTPLITGVTAIKFSNGTVTDEGGGIARIDVPGDFDGGSFLDPAGTAAFDYDGGSF